MVARRGAADLMAAKAPPFSSDFFSACFDWRRERDERLREREREEEEKEADDPERLLECVRRETWRPRGDGEREKERALALLRD